MANLGTTYNVNDLPQGNSYDPLPAGWYDVTITNAELATTKSGGTMIKVRFDVTGPNYQGRVVFGNINIRNANPKAEEIGMQQLGDIARAIGLSQVSDTDQLIGGHLAIKLTIKQDDQYGPQNEIKGYKAMNGSAPVMPSAPVTNGQAAQPQAQKSAATPPWKRG